MAETETLDTATAVTTNGAADWRASLPDELRAEKSLESFKDVGALAKSYVETKRMVGDALKVPGDKATPEEMSAFYTKLGRPEAADKYTVKAPTFPEDMGIAWDGELQAAFLSQAHTAGLSNTQAQGMIDWYARALMRQHDSATTRTAAERKQAESALRQVWGTAHDRNVGLARAAAHKLFGADPDVLEAFEGKGNNPAIVRGLHAVGELLFERGEIRGDDVGGGRTADEIEAEISRIREDPKSAGNLQAGERIVALTAELLNLRDRQNRK
jgi:hypothetical protein